MARDRHKGGRDRAVGALEGRPKALRRELSDLETELERARRRRDRSQARVEALEAIAEQLAVALAAAEAARERRRSQQDATLVEPAVEDASAADPEAVRAESSGEGAHGPAAPASGSTSTDDVALDEGGAAVATATVRSTRRAKSARKARPAS